MNDGDLKRFLESRRTLLVCLLLAAVTFGVYWQVSRFEFTNYDEFIMILKNPYVLGGLTLQGVTWALTTSWFDYWHPLPWISHMLDCELFGLNPGWHHLVNLVFHVADSLLLFGVLRQMTGAFWRSAIVAALFALHPLHVESVAWVPERKDTLSTLFFLLTLWAYTMYVERIRGSSVRPGENTGGPVSEEPEANSGPLGRTHTKGRRSGGGLASFPAPGERAAKHGGKGVPAPFLNRHSPLGSTRLSNSPGFWYLVTLGMFALGLMSKPMVLTLPFVLFLLDYWPLRRFKVPGDQAGISIPESQVRGQEPAPSDKLPPTPITHHTSRITFPVSRSTLLPLLIEKLPFFALTAFSCAISYLGVKAGGSIFSAEQVSWGLRLANVPVSYVRYLGKMIWPSDLIAMYPMPSHWAVWQVGGAVAVLALISLLAVVRARSAPYLIVGWLFFLGILVPIIGIVQAGFQSIADRYTYIPSIGIFIAVVWAAAEWGSTRSRVTVLASAAAVVLVLLGCVTWVQAGYWRNSLTLWTHCLAVCPDNLVARYNLGYVLQHAGKTSDAIAQYQAALRLKPDHLDANLNLGIALVGNSRPQEATNYLAIAVRIKPDYARAWGALGLALYELGDYASAVTHCAEAIRLDPDAFGPYVDMGRALSAQGKSDEALRFYAEGLRLNPSLAQTHYYLGLEWMKRRAFAQAEASFGEAVRLAPGWAEARVQQQHALDEVNKR